MRSLRVVFQHRQEIQADQMRDALLFRPRLFVRSRRQSTRAVLISGAMLRLVAASRRSIGVSPNRSQDSPETLMQFATSCLAYSHADSSTAPVA